MENNSDSSLSSPPPLSYSPPLKKHRSNAKNKSTSKSNNYRIPKYSNDNYKFARRLDISHKIGSHCSAAGGVDKAIITAAINGSNAFALFLSNQRQWKSKPLSQDDIDRFNIAMLEHKYDRSLILPHGNYLINLGNPNHDTRQKSLECFIGELQKCELLGLALYNFHPGSSVGLCSIEECCKKIGESITIGQNESTNVIILIENMAGQGSTVGKNFEELKMIIDNVKDKSRVGVCLDTCHLFASGYNLSTYQTYSDTFKRFDEIVGFRYLKALHMNDSLTPHDSKKDRHHNIGVGYIGLNAFDYIMNDDRLANIPMILETPASESGEDIWSLEIDLLHSLQRKEVNQDKIHHLTRAIKDYSKFVK